MKSKLKLLQLVVPIGVFFFFSINSFSQGLSKMGEFCHVTEKFETNSISDFKGNSAGEKFFAADAIGGTLARDHQSRAMYFEGQHKRTYVTYMDDDFYARVTYYDHEEDEWLRFAELVDHCIAPNGLKDAHNVPNLYVTTDGTLHLFYGSHGHSFKYARTTNPEDISQWETGMRVGSRATYPYLRETKDGRLLLFYRYGPKGGYNHPYLGLQYSDDFGKSWSDIKKLATFSTGCKISRVVYDSVRNRIHLSLDIPDKPRWKAFHCMYLPDTGDLRALNGEVLGPLAKEEDFLENDPLNARENISLCINDGRVYFLFREEEKGMCFGYWDGNGLKDHPVTEGTFKGLVGTPSLYTEDGKTFRVYAICDRKDMTDRPSQVKHNGNIYHKSYYHGMNIYFRTEASGGDVMVWTTTDRGKTWDSGKYLLERGDVGHVLGQVNLVMNYSGKGPFLITNEPTASWPTELKPTGSWAEKNEKDRALYRQTHYDNPAREWKRLYSIDRQGNLVVGK